jgi:uncharacterized membrane protein
MRRDTKIVFWVTAAIPAVILSLSAAYSWAIAQGAPAAWRIPFRLFCHGIVERCLELFGTPMPICSRCTAIYVGLLAGLLLFLFLPPMREAVIRVIALAAVTPLAIDGLTQLAGLRESSNPLRMATGMLAGLAFGVWVLSAVERAGETAMPTP